MTEHMTAAARAIAMQAYEHAIRLGHPYLGVTPGRAAVEASFWPEALSRAARTAHRPLAWFDLRPRSGAGRKAPSCRTPRCRAGSPPRPPGGAGPARR